MAELDDPRRLNELDGAVLDKAPDEVLNASVREAAERAGAPIALVSIVMRRIQLFRAWYGLPPDLAVSRATSRCDSFCQFVVRTERPFVVSEASADPRVPQELVGRYGIQAYAGVPLRRGDHVLGSLCVIDVKPRSFDPGLIDALTDIAERVVQRLEELREVEGAEPRPRLSEAEVRAAVEGLLRDGQVVERALREIDAVLRAAASIDAAHAAAELGSSYAGLQRDIGMLYGELFEQLSAMRESALRIAASRGDAEGAALEQAARSLSRSLAEVAPLVRLITALVEDGSIGADAFARNASVLREALDFDRDIVAALRTIYAAAARALGPAARPGPASAPPAAAPPGAGGGDGGGT